ncbi:MAG: DUF5818 domain-containing protein [Desulfobacteraceae bacterium]|jgi:acylphosphatase
MKSNLIKCLAVMLIVGLMAATGAIAGESSVTGTVQNTDNGIVISADDGSTYNVMGADLSEFVGKTVKATGTLDEGASGKVLTVVSVEPAE